MYSHNVYAPWSQGDVQLPTVLREPDSARQISSGMGLARFRSAVKDMGTLKSPSSLLHRLSSARTNEAGGRPGTIERLHPGPDFPVSSPLKAALSAGNPCPGCSDAWGLPEISVGLSPVLALPPCSSASCSSTGRERPQPATSSANSCPPSRGDNWSHFRWYAWIYAGAFGVSTRDRRLDAVRRGAARPAVARTRMTRSLTSTYIDGKIYLAAQADTRADQSRPADLRRRPGDHGHDTVAGADDLNSTVAVLSFSGACGPSARRCSSPPSSTPSSARLQRAPGAAARPN